jgi:CubicO group peptidase (beta-lactamase class C family)
MPATAVPTRPAATATPAAEAGAQIDLMLSNLAEHSLLSGAVLVAREGEILLSRGYGLANRDTNAPNTPQTIFRVTAITDGFTGMAILMLENDGRLEMDAPLCDYIPDCPAHWQPVTLHHLLTHTSGILEDPDDWLPIMATPTPVDHMLELFRDEPPAFEPGQRFEYSLWDYFLLGHVVEQVSGQSYGDFLSERMFTPLGMNHSGYGPLSPEWATGYADADTRADIMDPSIAFAAGGAYSTVEDLYRWHQALDAGTLLPQAVLDRIVSEPNPYGITPNWDYGWKRTSVKGHAVIQSTGYIPGFAGHISRYLDEDAVIIALFNQSDVDADQIAGMIVDKLFGP